MRKWLIGALALGIVAVGSLMGVYFRVNSCATIYDQRLSNLAASDPVPDRNWEQWIRENYGYLAWNISHHSSADLQVFGWETPFKRYDVIFSDKWNYALVTSKAFTPTLEDILRCVGTPEYYEGNYSFVGVSYHIYSALWYPQIGFAAIHALYQPEVTTLVEENSLRKTDQFRDFFYGRPGDIESVVHQYLHRFILISESEYPEYLEDVKPWPGLENTVFEFKE